MGCFRTSSGKRLKLWLFRWVDVVWNGSRFDEFRPSVESPEPGLASGRDVPVYSRLPGQFRLFQLDGEVLLNLSSTPSLCVRCFHS